MKALITGVAGQDGTLLSQMLLDDGFEVVGLVKPGHDITTLQSYAPATIVLSCDLGDPVELEQLIVDLQPDQIYNLGGISSLSEAAAHPEVTRRVNVGAVEAILSASRRLARQNLHLRFVQAASGTVFEGTEVSPQNELTPRCPVTPYAVGKAETLELIDTARAEGLFATAAILYNHESPLRGESFVTRRITQAVAKIAAGQQEFLELGNLDVSRDWGWAPDYVRAMRLMLSADVPHDYVLGTGQSHELTDFIALAFKAAGISDWQSLVRSNDDLRRHTDPTLLRGDSSRAYAELGWQHTKTFEEIAQSMVKFDQLLLGDPQALWHEA
ncbi:MAG: GDP-mannose 4,6-dehydratase [Actinomycetota bacterium]|nr:GDP-mannose 4,6-dehydratase [Actinomycetota bacterium]